jgi:acyl carrier protein
VRLRREGGTVEIAQIEARLAVLWAEVFELENVAHDADFFALGGDSLKGLEIAAAIEDEFGVALGPEAFTQARSVRALTLLIAHERPASARPTPLSPARDDIGEYPLTFAQEQIWRYCLDARAARLYLTRSEIVVAGVVDEATLRGSVARMVKRHPILRTVFVEGDAGPVQRVLGAMTIPITLIDLSRTNDPAARVRELAHTAIDTWFDLERGPLLELTVLRLGPSEHHLILVFHHIVFDGHSVQLFWHELGAQHEALVSGGEMLSPVLPRASFGNFAIRQRAQLSGESEQLNRWLAALRDPPPSLELPFPPGLPGPARDAADGVVSHPLPAELVRRCEALASEIGATYYVFGLAAYAAQLAAETGRVDFALGVYVLGRPQPELRATLGLFSHLVALRLRFDPGLSLREWVAYVRGAVLDAGRHGDLPYELVAKELARVGSAAPDITTIFSVMGEGSPDRFGRSAATLVRRRDRLDAMPWGFSLWTEHYPGDGEQRLRANFDAHRYEPAAVASFLTRLEALLEIASDEPDVPLGRLNAAVAGARSG